MRWCVVVCVGCWSGAPKPADVATPAPTEACVIRDYDVQPMHSLELAIDGEVFATVFQKMRDVEIAVTDLQASRAQIELEDVVLSGDLHVAELSFATRNVYDGWVEVRGTPLREVIGASARLEVALPTGILPASIQIDVRCSALTLQQWTHDNNDELVQIMSSTPLLRAPNGAAVAKVVVTPATTISGPVLERRSGFVRVRLTESNAVVGWVAESATERRELELVVAHGHRMNWAWRKQVCSKSIPIFAKSPKRGVVRVGQIKANQPVVTTHDPNAGDDEVPISLGPGTVKPFVRATDLATCQY